MSGTLTGRTIDLKSSHPPKGGTVRRSRGNWWALPFLLPSAFLTLAVLIVPWLVGGVYAFTNWDGLTWNFHFIGLNNFSAFIHDSTAIGALLHTFVITIAVTVGQNVIGLLLALAVNSQIKSKHILRVIFFAPALVTPIIVAYLWGFIYDGNGPINTALSDIGLGSLRRVWLGEPGLVLASIIVVILWQFSGFLMVIYLAGLLNIPEELIEAAHIDGASPAKIFFLVKLPLLKPAITIGSLLVLIGGLKTFDQVWALTQGGPGGASQTLATYVYQLAFEFGRYGYATAVALVMTVIILIASLAQMLLTHRNNAGQ